MSEVEQAVEPQTEVHFYNPVYPNELITLRSSNPKTKDKTVKFTSGYFRATEPWQVELITSAARSRVYEADVAKDMTCPDCGWVTRSSQAYLVHCRQHP